MPFKDLRQYLEAVDRFEQLRTVEGADCDLEIGGLTELCWERGGPVLLFDAVQGYARGYRLVTNLLDTLPRCALAIGLSPDCSREQFIEAWKRVLTTFEPIRPREVASAPFMENRLVGDDVDLLRFPAPKWHELDGNRYLGTGAITIVQDPDQPWVNLGIYRAALHDPNTVGLYISPGQHARIVREKFWARGESCPVAITFGQDPTAFIAAGQKMPWGASEYDFAGFLLGEPAEVVKGPITGLPLPAGAEIVIEGECPPVTVESRMEGPFGEWNGYYASDPRPEAIVKVKAVYYRDDPIVHGEPPFRPPSEGFFGRPEVHAAALHLNLEKAGLPDIRGVAEYGGSCGLHVVSLKQRYHSHAMEAATVLARHSYQGGFIVVVDDDIDPWNLEEVIWALGTRCDAATDIQVAHGFRSSLLDPKLPPEKRARRDLTASVAVLNACRPYHWIAEFPPVNRMSNALRERVAEKWASYLGLNQPTLTTEVAVETHWR
jgi:UbiD family decarboxylase